MLTASASISVNDFGDDSERGGSGLLASRSMVGWVGCAGGEGGGSGGGEEEMCGVDSSNCGGLEWGASCVQTNKVVYTKQSTRRR